MSRRLGFLLKVMPIVTAVGLCVWTVFIYVSHDRELNRLQAEQLNIDNAIKDIQRGQLVTEGELKSTELKYQIEGRFSIEENFWLKRLSGDEEGLYLVHFEVTLVNKSKATITVPVSILDVWRGSLKSSPSLGDGQLIDSPPSRWDAGPTGDMAWTLAATRAWAISPSELTSYSLLDLNPSTRGGGTGIIREGERTFLAQEAIVRAKDKDQIGVTYSFKANDGNGTLQWHVKRSDFVSNATAPSATDAEETKTEQTSSAIGASQ